MNAPPTNYKAGIIILLVFFGFNTSLYAQTNSETEEVKQYKELIEYQTNHIIEQEEDTESFSETMTGIGMKTPDDLFLAELLVSEDPDKLKKAKVDEAVDEDAPAEEFEFVEYDDLFADSDDGNSGSGFTVGTGGSCPPGHGGGFGIQF